MDIFVYKTLLESLIYSKLMMIVRNIWLRLNDKKVMSTSNLGTEIVGQEEFLA